MFRHFTLAWMLLALIPLTAAESGGTKKKKAEKTAVPVAHMVLEQKFLCQEDFSKGMPPKPLWNPDLVGAWTVVDGHLDGAEREKDHHAAVIFANVTALPAVSVVRFRFRLGEANDVQSMGQGVNDKSQRVTFLLQINQDGFRLAAMADKTADPAEKDHTWFPKVAQAFDRQSWYQMTLELNGDEALAWTDEQHVSYVRHPVFLKQRWGISLRTNGKDKVGSFADVWLTSGVVATGWEKLRLRFEELAAKQAKK